MMQWSLICHNGEGYTLPAATAWRIEYGLGIPCDSVAITCPWQAGQEEILQNASRITGKQDGKIRFFGVVDECECVWQDSGVTLEIIGRGMQALRITFP